MTLGNCKTFSSYYIGESVKLSKGMTLGNGQTLSKYDIEESVKLYDIGVWTNGIPTFIPTCIPICISICIPA